MNVSLSNLNKQYQVHYQRSAIDTFTRQQTMQNGMIDLYVRGNNSVAYSDEYSNAIVHAFQGFRAPFSGKIVHIFPEQSAVI